jgi:hypothetical protein
MTKFSRRAAAEVPDKNSDNARERIRPRVEGMPLRPSAISDIYSKGKIRPYGTAGDGLADRKTRERDVRLQKPQDPIEGREKSYGNDVSEGSWLRGGGEGHRPNMDRGKYDISDKPGKPASGLKASGTDCHSSPFSAAHNMKPRS